MANKIKKTNFKKIARELIVNLYKKYGFQLVALIFLAVLIAFTEGFSMILLMPLLISMGIDSSSNSPIIVDFVHNIMNTLGLDKSLFILTSLIFIVLLIQLSLLVILNWFLAWYQRDYGAYWSKRIFSSYFYSQWEIINQQKLGDFTNLIINETSRLSASFMTLMQITTSIITIIIYLVISFLISFEITISIVIVAIFLFICVMGISKKNYDIGNQLGPLTSHFTVKVTEFFSNIKLIKVTVTELKAINEISKIIDILKNKHILATFLPTLVRAFFEFGAFLSLCLILIFGHKYLEQSPTSTLVIIAMFIRLLPKFNSLQQNIQLLGNYIPAYQFITDKLSITDKGKEENIFKKKNSQKNNEKVGSLKINIKNAGYGNINILHDINLEFPETGLVGIVGHSGAGKSTLINSILGLTNIKKGNIKIGKFSLENTSLSDWRKLIGYVPQETMLLNTSIYNNITWAKKNTSKSHVIKYAKKAFAHDFIMQKENGYNTDIGDKGIMLSGGQKQRIAIARALILEPKILIMDESTNSLDHESELKINETISNLKKNTCVIVISHKIQNLIDADKIIFMKNGKVIEQDSWKNLIKQKGQFYNFMKKNNLA